tara:strand:+ start:377 stop:595 length:219 start_codon:yes stop_codon:yes gene_type:complete
MMNKAQGLGNFGIKVKSYKENKDGSVDMQVDLTEKFKSWFMYMERLEKWNEEHFNKWFLKTIGDYIGVDPNE